MATFVLIVTMIFTTATGQVKVVNVVYPKAMTQVHCMELHKNTVKDRRQMAKRIANERNRAIKHIFGTCSNVKKLLDSAPKQL